MNKKIIIGDNVNGKNILVIGGVHGDELTPIYSVYLYQQFLENKNVKKDFNKLTIINAINESGIENCSREMKNNSTQDLNRKLSHNNENILSKDIEELICDNDIIIDCHSSPKCCDFVLLNMDEYNNSYVDFCKKNDINYLNRYSSANTIKKYALDIDKVSFTIELNKMNYIDFQSASNGKYLIDNIVRNIKNMTYEKSEPKYSSYIEFNHHKSGLFIPSFELGDIVTMGDELGQIIDIKDSKYNIHKVMFNKKGKYRLICRGISDYTSPKDAIYYIQEVE